MGTGRLPGPDWEWERSSPWRRADGGGGCKRWEAEDFPGTWDSQCSYMGEGSSLHMFWGVFLYFFPISII